MKYWLNLHVVYVDMGPYVTLRWCLILLASPRVKYQPATASVINRWYVCRPRWFWHPTWCYYDTNQTALFSLGTGRGNGPTVNFNERVFSFFFSAKGQSSFPENPQRLWPRGFPLTRLWPCRHGFSVSFKCRQLKELTKTVSKNGFIRSSSRFWHRRRVPLFRILANGILRCLEWSFKLTWHCFVPFLLNATLFSIVFPQL